MIAAGSMLFPMIPKVRLTSQRASVAICPRNCREFTSCIACMVRSVPIIHYR
ncbi:MAG: hypothetical protein A4E38_01920 [Methanoregulaceae archaeon PtaB.Bin108]|nr:MAG: hypothetical protein A4E38_01920 [Methanoregulaceae archaeon PtaB.Bin108]